MYLGKKTIIDIINKLWIYYIYQRLDLKSLLPIFIPDFFTYIDCIFLIDYPYVLAFLSFLLSILFLFKFSNILVAWILPNYAAFTNTYYCYFLSPIFINNKAFGLPKEAAY